MGRKYAEVKENEAKVLEELEKILGKEIKREKNIQWDKIGYRSEEESVVDLNLNFKELPALPESLGDLEMLQTLFLHKNQLKSLPESIGNLKLLTLLALSENKLKVLPESFGKLFSLKELWLNLNRLVELPASFTNLKPLVDLNIEHNQLPSLPETFGKLTALQTFDVSHNQLTTIPESLGNLRALRTLDLGHNKLDYIPETIGNLKALQKLDLSYNSLKVLPGSMGNLKALQSLDLQRNQLKTIPGSLWRLPNLISLTIKSNPLGREWDMIKNKGMEAVLDYCRKIGSISVFISYVISDYEAGKYHIAEIAEDLKKRDEISYSYHCMQDMKKTGKIDKFMNETIPQCQILLFVATKNSIQSQYCQHELAIAQTHNIKIIPILGKDLDWEDPLLSKLGLNREFGLQFSTDIHKLCNEIYDYILEYKRTKDVFTRDETDRKDELYNVKHTVMNFLESDDFAKILKKNLPRFKELFQTLNTNRISPRNYFLECAALVTEKSKKAAKS